MTVYGVFSCPLHKDGMNGSRCEILNTFIVPVMQLEQRFRQGEIIVVLINIDDFTKIDELWGRRVLSCRPGSANA